MAGLSASGFSLGWLVPAGVGNAGGLMVPNAHKSAPGTPHPGEQRRGCMRAMNSNAKLPALELRLQIAALLEPAQGLALQPQPQPRLYARATRSANNRARTNPAATRCRNKRASANRTRAAKCDARASADTARASGSPIAVGAGLSSAAAGGSGWRMFEAQPSLRQTRPMRAAQGTAQRPCLRLAFSLVRFFWRSKRNELGRRAETRLAT